ncbi:MAG: BlaI/MecI/CopY family transcriptional regulator [Verrucomicrobiota bacterium]
MSHLAHSLSRRERQIVDILFKEGEASVSEVQVQMPSAPGYSAVRAMLRILENKGVVQHRKEGKKYIFRVQHSVEDAKRSALSQLMETFFNGSPKELVSTLISSEESEVTPKELEELQAMLEDARRRES